MKYVRVFALETYVAWRTLTRYPLDAVSSVVVMYFLYMGIFFGGMKVVGGLPEHGAVSESIISYAMWFLTLLAISSISRRISAEAQRGTIEQLFLASFPPQVLLVLRSIGEVLFALALTFLVTALISWSTGVSLPFGWAQLPVLLITLVGLWGFGLALAGVTLLAKQSEQFITLVQFGLLPIALNPQVWIMAYFPLTVGIRVLIAPGGFTDILHLTAVSAIWLIFGIVVFGMCTRWVKRIGSLGHY